MLLIIGDADMDIRWEINESIKSLYLDYPLFGEVLVAVEREVSNSVPTAAVTSNLKLIVNPDFWATLDKEGKKAVLAHEIMHLMFNHFERFQEQFKENPELVNIALDCAINQLIPFKLPDNHVTVEFVEKITKTKLERKHSSEYYYNKMMQSSCSVSISPDHSEQFKEGNVLNKSKMENLLRKAIDAQKKHEMKRGTNPNDSLVNIVPERIRTNPNVWKSMINKSFGDVPSVPEYVYGRQSRRNKDSFYGKRMLLTDPHVWVIIDSSGSISDEELCKFTGHINSAMRKYDTCVTLIECDAEIQKISNIKGKIKNINIKGRGGTDLTKGINYIKDVVGKSKTRVIMLTDGYTNWDAVPDNLVITAIYTQTHEPLEHIKNSATL